MKFTNMTPPEGVGEFEMVDTILDEGLVSFSVISAKNATSKSGNQQLVTYIKIVDSKGRANRINDYFPDMPSMYWKTKHFFQAINRGHLFTQNFDPDSLKGAKGKVTIKKVKETYNGETKFVNKVVDYGSDAQSKQIELPVGPASTTAVDEDLPF